MSDEGRLPGRLHTRILRMTESYKEAQPLAYQVALLPSTEGTTSDRALERTLLPPSKVKRARTFMVRYLDPRRPKRSLPSSSMELITALGENSNASPTRRETILSKIKARSSCCVFSPLRDDSVPADALAKCFVEAAARWPLSACSHSGDVNRWTIVMEHRSSSDLEMVGSWVEMMMRAPRWR